MAGPRHRGRAWLHGPRTMPPWLRRYDKALDTFLSTAPGGDSQRETSGEPRPGRAHRPSGTRHPTAPHGTRHARPRRDETGLHVHVSPLSPHPLRSPRSKTRERRLPCRRDERHTRRKTTRVGPEGSRDRIRLIVVRRSAIKRRHLPGSQVTSILESVNNKRVGSPATRRTFGPFRGHGSQRRRRWRWCRCSHCRRRRVRPRAGRCRGAEGIATAHGIACRD